MIIDMVGIMYLWNIELNAVSLVNLVIVSFEFNPQTRPVVNSY